jgi:hypothetical protein
VFPTRSTDSLFFSYLWAHSFSICNPSDLGRGDADRSTDSPVELSVETLEGVHCFSIDLASVLGKGELVRSMAGSGLSAGDAALAGAQSFSITSPSGFGTLDPGVIGRGGAGE